MKRPIAGYHRDEEGHFVAELSCGHGQHVRHDPPLVERPWVLDEAGRAARLGEPLDCVRCDRREWPEGFTEHRRTPEFDEATLPAGLRTRHRTKPGVWARIRVRAGHLRYRVHGPFDDEQVLEPGIEGIVLPEVEHEVEPLGPVAFHLAFFRRAR